MLGVTLSKNARARAVQLPAWNEALGLPRPWDQQWSLRIQQVLAYESDLLEYDDIFEGSHVVEAKVAELVEGARAEIDRVQPLGGAVAAVESRLHEAGAGRVARRPPPGSRPARRSSSASTASRPPSPPRSPPTSTRPSRASTREAEASGARGRCEEWKAAARRARGHRALARLAADAKTDTNLMAATLEAARAGATTGEWAGALREVFGEFRAPTGVSGAVGVAERGRGARPRCGPGCAAAPARSWAAGCGCSSASPGLDGHSNGAEQIAVRARDAGFEVVYQGIRLTPEQIVGAAVAEDVHLVGISILSGSHMELVPEVLDGLRDGRADDVPVIVGGIIPDSDALRLARRGWRRFHAQGLRADRDHGRDRRPDPRRPRPRLTRRTAAAGRPGGGALPAPGARPTLERAGDARGDPAAVEAALAAAPPARRRRRRRRRRRASRPRGRAAPRSRAWGAGRSRRRARRCGRLRRGRGRRPAPSTRSTTSRRPVAARRRRRPTAAGSRSAGGWSRGPAASPRTGRRPPRRDGPRPARRSASRRGGRGYAHTDSWPGPTGSGFGCGTSTTVGGARLAWRRERPAVCGADPAGAGAASARAGRPARR